MDKTQITIHAYNKNAERYVKKFMDFTDYNEKIDRFSKYINKGDKILDLGCGPGNVAKQLWNSVGPFEYIGVDLSEEMLNIARKTFEWGTFFCTDLKDIDFENSAFDIIVMSFCIVHLDNDEMSKLISKVSKYLRPSGKLYISFMSGKKEGFESTSFSEEKIFFNYYSVESIRQELSRNDFKVIDEIQADYIESDDSITTDNFLFAEKL